jgi:LCP family protein required for cell wall assembly
MQSTTTKGGFRARSPFVAAFLSLLFPGLGHAYAGTYQRALAFAAVPVLLLALLAGIVLRVDLAQLGGFAILPGVLPGIFVLNLVALAYRLVAMVDAWRVTAYLNSFGESGGRPERPGAALGSLSVAGLLAAILVMAGGHVAVARYDLLAMNVVDCIFDPNSDCPAGSATPSPSGSEEPLDSEEPEPTVSLPPEGSAVPDITTPPWNGTERLNILLIGADEQGGGHNTDTLIVLSVDPVSRQVALFSLPRDTVDVPLPPGNPRRLIGPVYRGKINSFFVRVRDRADIFPGTDKTRGYNGLKAILGELYGLDIKYFVEVNFDGFTKIIDALGGITINVQVPLADDHYPGEHGMLRRVFVAAGVQRMSGAQALIYARSRHSTDDYERGQRQQRVLLSLRQSVDIGSILPRINELAAAVSQAVRTDIPRELVPRLLSLAQSVDARSLRSYVFAPLRYGSEHVEPERGFVIIPNVARIRAAVREAFVVDPAVESRRVRLAKEAARVWVLNGSGEQGQAARIAGYLDWLGFNVSAPNRAPVPAGLQGTRIVVYNGAGARLTESIAVLEGVFGVKAQIAADPTAGADIIVSTGRQTPDLTPPPAP